jgi:hypothetical protein
MSSAETAYNSPRKINSRWRKGAQRYPTDRTVEHTRFVRQPDGARRRKTDAPSEAVFVSRLRESPGFRNVARIRKLGD